MLVFFFFSSRRRHTRLQGDWSSDVCSSDLIFLDDTPRVREEGPVSADSAAIFVRLSDVVGADRHKAAIANLHLTMEFKKPFSLSAVPGAETAAAEDKHPSDAGLAAPRASGVSPCGRKVRSRGKWPPGTMSDR